MKKLAIGLLAIAAIATNAFAQSSPDLYNGQVPTAAQWNSYFSAKQDYLGTTGTGPLARATEPALTATATGGSVSRSLQAHFGDYINVADCGASPSASATVNNAAFANCIAAVPQGAVIVVGPGTYNLTANLTYGAASKAAQLIGVGGPVLNFTGLGSTADAIDIAPDAYQPTLTQGLTINCNGSGRDCVSLQSGSHPVLRDLKISNAGRDNLALSVTGYSFLQNTLISNVQLNSAARNPIRFETEGSNGAFINDTDLLDIEIRGVGAGGNPVYVKDGGTGAASQISRVTGTLTIDFQNQSGAQADPKFLHFVYTSGALNVYGAWHITGGGWENTGAAFTGSVLAPLAYADAGASVGGLTIEGIIPGAGVADITPNIVSDKIETSALGGSITRTSANCSTPSIINNPDANYPQSTYFCLGRQGPEASTYNNMPSGLALNSSAPTDQDQGMFLAGGRQTRSGSCGTSASCTLTIPYVVPPETYTDAATSLLVMLGNREFIGSGNIFTRMYMVQVTQNGTVSALQVADGSTANMMTSVTFSASGTSLVVNYTTSTAWANGGGSGNLWATTLGPSFIP